MSKKTRRNYQRRWSTEEDKALLNAVKSVYETDLLTTSSNANLFRTVKLKDPHQFANRSVGSMEKRWRSLTAGDRKREKPESDSLEQELKDIYRLKEAKEAQFKAVEDANHAQAKAELAEICRGDPQAAYAAYKDKPFASRKTDLRDEWRYQSSALSTSQSLPPKDNSKADQSTVRKRRRASATAPEAGTVQVPSSTLSHSGFPGEWHGSKRPYVYGTFTDLPVGTDLGTSLSPRPQTQEAADPIFPTFVPYMSPLSVPPQGSAQTHHNLILPQYSGTTKTSVHNSDAIPWISRRTGRCHSSVASSTGVLDGNAGASHHPHALHNPMAPSRHNAGENTSSASPTEIPEFVDPRLLHHPSITASNFHGRTILPELKDFNTSGVSMSLSKYQPRSRQSLGRLLSGLHLSHQRSGSDVTDVGSGSDNLSE